MSSRIRTDVKKLFEFWCEVTRTHGVDRSTRAGAAVPAGIITESFPERFRDEKTIADIPAFAFPCEFESDSVQSYSFVLTTDDSKWRFGFCRHDPKTDSAMVIITYLPWHDTFLRLLTVLTELRRTDNDDFRTFLAEAYNSGVPDQGKKLNLFYNDAQSYFVFERPTQFQLPSIPENHNLNLYYNFVDPKNMIAVFAAMLAERRIIFTSRRLDKLSSCIQAAHAFLYPMVWQHIFIPLLPMKLKDYLSAPMPYLIGVPEMVLETMTPDELGEVVILNCDTKIFESPFDDVREMPLDIVSQLKKKLSHSSEHIGDQVSKIFLNVLVQLISGYRDAVEFRESGKTFSRDKFIESRPKHLRPFLTKMMDLQIFQQFIDERLEMLNTGLGCSDEFELETARYAEKKRRRHYEFLNNVKEKTNPAVKSAVKSVKEGSRGVKTAYKDLKSKFRDITPPNSTTQFRSHLASNSQHDRIDGYVVVKPPLPKGGAAHHSAPSSPIFSKRGTGVAANGHEIGCSLSVITAGGFKYANPEDINGAASHYGRRVQQKAPLVLSSSPAHLQSNGYTGAAHGATHLNSHLGASPTVSPASSLASSEMNLSQELQNHPLFKPPAVDRSLKPSSSFELNHQRIIAARTGGPPPARPPPPIVYMPQTMSSCAPATATPPYYNHPYAQQKRQPPPSFSEATPNSQSLVHPHVTYKPPSIPRLAQASQEHKVATADTLKTSTPNKIITTASIFDNPPDMQSPPVPPRRQQCNHASIHRLERNCWQDYADRSLLQHDALRNSSSSNTSNVSSSSGSSASFVSASSNLFYHSAAASSTELAPVPAPRQRKEKESLRSLQTQHLPHPNPSGSLHSAAPSTSSQEDTMNDLISLEDSNNTSFDLEDFDPLNQNARPLPPLGGGAKKSTTLPTGASNAFLKAANGVSNPLYPQYTPQHKRLMQPPSVKPPPLPTSVPPPMPPPDEDFELLRKYGLDQFTLTTATANAAATATATKANMQNWTTFD